MSDFQGTDMLQSGGTFLIRGPRPGRRLCPPMPGCFSQAVSDCCMGQPIPLFRARWPWRQSPRLSSPAPPPWSCPSSGARGEDRCPPADASKGHQTWCSCMARERRCSTRISACSRSSQRRSSREARLSRS